MAAHARTGLLVGFLLFGSSAAWADSVSSAASPSPRTLTVFAGGLTARTAALRDLLDQYGGAHPGLAVRIATGASTSEQQRQYLSTLLGARDATYDVIVIDVINPAEYAAAGWLEPLDAYLSPTARTLGEYFPAARTADRVDGRVVALPWVIDCQFLYYRQDLLAKYHLLPPTTWDELAAAAQRIVAGEGSPALFGLSVQGAPIEGTVCTFLLPYWSQGRDLLDARGRLTLDRNAALASLRLWTGLQSAGVLRRSAAETKTADTTNEFLAGNAVFAVNWGAAWAAAERSPDSRVRGRVGVARVPRVAGGVYASALGGWGLAVSAFSAHKPEAVDLIRFLASRDALRTLLLRTGSLPARTDLFADADLAAQVPFLPFAREVILSARSRPITPRYSEVSDILRSATSAVLGGSTPPEAAVDGIGTDLERVLEGGAE